MGQGEIEREPQRIPNPRHEGRLHLGPPHVHLATARYRSRDVLMHAEEALHSVVLGASGTRNEQRLSLCLQFVRWLAQLEQPALPPRILIRSAAVAVLDKILLHGSIPFHKQGMPCQDKVLKAVTHGPAAGTGWRVKLVVG